MRRGLLAIELQNESFSKERVNRLRAQAVELFKLDPGTVEYYVFTNSIQTWQILPIPLK